MSPFQMRASNKLAVLIPVVAVLFFSATFAHSTFGQAVAEAAGATSVSAGVASSVKPVTMPKFPAVGAAAGSPSPHLVAASGPPPEETNRRTLEANAGKDAGK